MAARRVFHLQPCGERPGWLGVGGTTSAMSSAGSLRGAPVPPFPSLHPSFASCSSGEGSVLGCGGEGMGMHLAFPPRKREGMGGHKSGKSSLYIIAPGFLLRSLLLSGWVGGTTPKIWGSWGSSRISQPRERRCVGKEAPSG